MRAAPMTALGRSPLLACAFGLGACAAPDEAHVADVVVDAPGAGTEGFADPARATNGVRGGGELAGSLDVYSLDYRARPSITLAFSGGVVVDGPGADIVVFENGFREIGRDAWFMDPIVVEVSPDGVEWLAFPHDYVAEDETRYEPRPTAWRGFAGLSPVLLHAETNPVDPFDTTRAGGDAFDLATLGTGSRDDAEARALAERVRAEGVAFLRLTSAALLTNPDTGLPYPRDPISDGADIDGVAARHVVPAPGPR
ncbi:MAG: hypothetical protein OHK0013_03210 [Sandaracinaceae bacterium]